MKRDSSVQLTAIMMCALLVIMILPVSVSADIGPKSSTHIIFENMGDELCYATLLSKTESTGPSSVWSGEEEDARHNGNESFSYSVLDYETWKAFAEYEDADGYYFLQEGWQVNETKELAWTYYPPSSFKILLYYPETDTFVVSGICERYAFDTYYTVDMNGIEFGSVGYNEELSSDDRINAYRSYNIMVELLSLVARIVITVVIEMAIAWLFGYREKKQLLLLVVVNTVTQIILNLLLNLSVGGRNAPIYYIIFEVVVLVIEACVFFSLLEKFGNKQKPRWLAIVYALIANAVSFFSGILLVEWIPGIF